MIMSEKIEKLMEQFMCENPYGDSMELATFMYEKGKKDAYEEEAESSIVIINLFCFVC